MSETAIFKFIGDRSIHCKGCEHSIKLSLEKIPGVLEATPNRMTQSIETTLRPGTETVEQVRAKLEHLGYQVEEIRSSQPNK